MTARDIYDSVLVEINKENAQSFTTEEFNYILNKSILAFENERYNFYAANQQISDDLRVLVKDQKFSITDTTSIDPTDLTGAVFNSTSSYLVTSITTATTAILTTARDLVEGDTIHFGEDDVVAHVIATIVGNVITFSNAVSATAGVNIMVSTAPIAAPDNNVTNERTIDINFVSSDYLHLTSCRLVWKTKRPSTNVVSPITFPAKRLTDDMLNAIQNNTYLKPSASRPYYQLFDHSNNSGVTALSASTYKAYQNKPKIRIYIGSKNTVMELRSIEFNYLKVPEVVTLNDSDIFSIATDTSQLIELPDYLKNEIVKRCAIFLLEKVGDPRVQSHPMFNQEMSSMPVNMQLDSRQRPQQNQQQNQQ